MTATRPDLLDELYERSAASFDDWELIKEIIDQSIDLTLNHRQSGHPGGSRSKVHLFVSLLLSGAMRWDIRHPRRRSPTASCSSPGTPCPLVYAMLAVYNEALRARDERDPDPRFVLPDEGRWALTWEDLLKLRRNGGLPGHAEMEGKTLFLKFNTGPSGHGMPPSAGEAVALKLAGAEEVKVFAMEGEGGLTPGASHETKNSAWGLGLEPGLPGRLERLRHRRPVDLERGARHARTWFEPLRLARRRHARGRGVGAGDAGGAGGGPWRQPGRRAGHGLVQDAQGPRLRQVRLQEPRHAARHELASSGQCAGSSWRATASSSPASTNRPRPTPPSARRRRAHNFGVAMGVLRDAGDVVDRISDRAGRAGGDGAGPGRGLQAGRRGGEIFDDPRFTDVKSYPAAMWKQPGEKAPNRAALATWGAWVNATARAEYDRPLVIACCADLAESTNIAGFAKDWEDLPGWGWYERDTNVRGSLLPQQITEFTNSGVTVGLATVNLADDPMTAFNGFWGACSTYGSFSYLKYGPMRLFSQLAQDCELKVGKVIWVAGHSGPETAEDSRTHFGIFAPGVTQLFPEGHVINLHPWEYNEVPVVLAAALRGTAHIVALHLTRPTVEIPDRVGAGHGLALRGGARRLRSATRLARLARPRARSTYRAPSPRPTWSRSCRAWTRRGSTCASWPPSARSCSPCSRPSTASASAPRPIAGTAWP